MEIKLGLYLFKTTLVYGLFAACFSIIGLFLPTAVLPDDPLATVTIEHVIGHIIWGMMAAFLTLSLRYIFVGGLFAIILDADHIVGFLSIESVSRMGHSIPFALLVPIGMMLIFGKRDFILGAISFAAVFSHLSFDILLDFAIISDADHIVGFENFPLYVPFSTVVIAFQGTDWIILQLIAVGTIIGVKLITEKRIKKNSFHETN